MSKYTKFILTANKGPNEAMQIPYTGIEPVAAKVAELLADGYTCEVVPFTQDEWRRGASERNF